MLSSLIFLVFARITLMYKCQNLRENLSVAVKASVILLNNLNCVDFASTCKQPLEEISLAYIIK